MVWLVVVLVLGATTVAIAVVEPSSPTPSRSEPALPSVEFETVAAFRTRMLDLVRYVRLPNSTLSEWANTTAGMAASAAQDRLDLTSNENDPFVLGYADLEASLVLLASVDYGDQTSVENASYRVFSSVDSLAALVSGVQTGSPPPVVLPEN